MPNCKRKGITHKIARFIEGENKLNCPKFSKRIGAVAKNAVKDEEKFSD
jgi:hypothetical protein